MPAAASASDGHEAQPVPLHGEEPEILHLRSRVCLRRHAGDGGYALNPRPLRRWLPSLRWWMWRLQLLRRGYLCHNQPWYGLLWQRHLLLLRRRRELGWR